LLVQEANPRIAADGDEAEMDASDAEAVKAEENEGDEDWVVVPGYSLPSPPRLLLSLSKLTLPTTVLVSSKANIGGRWYKKSSRSS
jgi:hypothetical protein